MQAIHDVLAPAKLNLFLHINQQRADGYHLLQSVFMLIDWYDRLHFDLLDSARIERVDSDTPFGATDAAHALPGEDLCVKAAKALQRATGCHKGARIYLEKNIPQQAGMGGGSSDAASTLLALNKLWGLNLSRGQLMAIGLTLGADVPFFLLGHNAWVEGIGEKLEPIDLELRQWVVLKPTKGVSTQEIFRSPDLQRSTNPVTILDFAKHPLGFGRNDLQPIAQSLCSEIGQAIQWLESFGLQARMTGSGSAVFAHLPSSKAHLFSDNLLLDASKQTGWKLKVCRNLNHHPFSEAVFKDN